MYWSITCSTSVAIAVDVAIAVMLTPPIVRTAQPSAGGSDPIVGEWARGVDYLGGHCLASPSTVSSGHGDNEQRDDETDRGSSAGVAGAAPLEPAHTALDAEVSTRHLSFLETGRARPSREMLLRLADRLEVPLRERNTMLLAAGFAPAYPERDLDDPALGVARAAIDRVLAGHEPFPALAIDRYWTLVTANRIVPALLTGVAAELLQPPINVLRLSLHPDGLAAQIENLPEWRAHLLARLSRQVELTADPRLSDLLQELGEYARNHGARNTDQPVLDLGLTSVA